MTSDPSTAIARFVRDTLGCRCPDEVLRSISVAIDQNDGHCRFVRLVVGSRLLVYICRTAENCAPATAARVLAHRGRTDRDAHGYNRFRLVLAPDDRSMFRAAEDAFAGAMEGDDRMFLHALSPHDLPDLTAPKTVAQKP
jgi:hypothetical protein